MPMLNWMGREKAVKRDKDVALKILREENAQSSSGGDVSATKGHKEHREGEAQPSVPLCDSLWQKKDPVRPILLFQAMPKNGEVPAEKLKAHLVDTLKIPESEIGIATGEQKELDKDVLDSIDLPGGFAFDETIYADNLDVYRGSWRFNKHYLGPFRIPSFDGSGADGEGEEFDCAREIDMNENVVCWLRNKDRDPRSFRLPMGGRTSWFYPDFIGQLDTFFQRQKRNME